jgi:hypothetical protein
LRQVYRAVQARLPFETNAICILPDHLHTIWTLPPGDADFDPTGQPRVQNRPEARAEFWASQGDFAHPTELSDYESAAIKPMPPNKPRGIPRVKNRSVLNGIFWA